MEGGVVNFFLHHCLVNRVVLSAVDVSFEVEGVHEVEQEGSQREHAGVELFLGGVFQLFGG